MKTFWTFEKKEKKKRISRCKTRRLNEPDWNLRLSWIKMTPCSWIWINTGESGARCSVRAGNLDGRRQKHEWEFVLNERRERQGLAIILLGQMILLILQIKTESQISWLHCKTSGNKWLTDTITVSCCFPSGINLFFIRFAYKMSKNEGIIFVFLLLQSNDWRDRPLTKTLSELNPSIWLVRENITV